MGRFSDLDKASKYTKNPQAERQAAAKLQNDLRNGPHSPNVHYSAMTEETLAEAMKERPLYFVSPEKPTTSVERIIERVYVVDQRYTANLSGRNHLFDDDKIESVVGDVTDDYNEAVEEDEDPTPNPARVVKHLLTNMVSGDPFVINNFEKQAKYIAEAKNATLDSLLGNGNPQLCYSPYFLKTETKVMKNPERGKPDRYGDYSEPEFKEYQVISYDHKKIEAFKNQLNEQLELQTKVFSDPNSNYNKMRKQKSRRRAPQPAVEAKKETPQPAPVKEPVKTAEPVKTEEPVKKEEPVKAEEPVKTEEPVKAEEPVKTEEPVTEQTATEETVKGEPIMPEPQNTVAENTATETNAPETAAAEPTATEAPATETTAPETAATETAATEAPATETTAPETAAPAEVKAPEPSVPFTEKRGSTNLNPCATIAPSPALFAEQITTPPYANHSALTDKLDVKQELLGIDTSAARATEEQKFAAFNQAVDATQKRQINYILKQICVRANRPESDAEKYLQEGKLTGPAFLEAFNELRIRVDSEGRKLNTQGRILGEKPDAFEKPMTVDKQEIAQILHESAMEKNIGAVDEKFRPINAENRESSARLGKYKTELTDAILKNAGYTKKELDDAFKSCFTPYDAEKVNYDALKEKKMAFIKQRMATYVPGTGGLDFDQRNEEVFVSECDKLDIALRAYVFPNNGVKNVDEKRAFHSLSKDEYEKFALENITPAALAKSMESKLSSYLRECRSYHSKIDMETACSYIKHLEDVHQKRPLLTRFVDYFKSGGEDSTIKRMKKALRVELSKRVDKERIPEVLADEDLTYDGVTYEDRFNSPDTQPQALNKIEEIANDKLELLEASDKGTQALKEEIANDQKEKEAAEAEPEEDIMDMLNRVSQEYIQDHSPAKQNNTLNK